MRDVEKYDVVVVGFGPTGQAATALLARLGHRVAAFDKWPALYGHPRLITIDGDSVRIVQACGADLELALRESRPHTRLITVNPSGEVLLDIDWTEHGLEHICGFPQKVEIYQPHVEQAMDAAGRKNGAEINQGWVISGLEQRDDSVLVTALPRTPSAHNGERTICAKYLIGADGAKSVVRQQLGIEQEDFGFGDGWLSVDVIKKRPLPARFDVPTITLDPGRNHAAIRIGTERMRFEFIVDPEEDNDHLLVREVGYAFLQETYGLTQDDVEIYRQALYPFAAKLCHRWREGRVFLAGDAAHLMPPFLGEGACSGLRDATTLATKLDLVLRGLSDESLLDTYSEERVPDVYEYLTKSVALGRIQLERDPIKVAERDAAFKRGEMPIDPPHPIMRTGVVQRGADGAVVAPAGDFSPQGVVRWRGRTGRFDDVVGWGYTLIASDLEALASLSEEQHTFLESLGAAEVAFEQEGDGNRMVADLGNVYSRYFEKYGLVALLSRPDFWVFGAARSLSEVGLMVDDLRVQLRVQASAHSSR